MSGVLTPMVPALREVVLTRLKTGTLNARLSPVLDRNNAAT